MTAHDSTSLPVEKLISGGQTGVDEGALDAAISLGLIHGGWCPRGRINERGVIPARFILRETQTASYSQRTQRNVVDSDATLIFFRDQLTGGTALTRQFAENHSRPCLCVDLNGESIDFELIRSWLCRCQVQILNVAGPRESSHPGIARVAEKVIRAIWQSPQSGSLGNS